MLSPNDLGLLVTAQAVVIISGPIGWFSRGLIFDRTDRPALVEAVTGKSDNAANDKLEKDTALLIGAVESRAKLAEDELRRLLEAHRLYA